MTKTMKISALVMMTTMLSIPAHAATWSGASGTNFNNAGNWDTLPGANAPLVFGVNGAGSNELLNDLTGASFGNFTFNSGAPSYFIRGNAFTWANNSQVYNNSGVPQNINLNVQLAAASAYTFNGFSTNFTGTFIGGTGVVTGLTVNNRLTAGGTLTLGKIVQDPNTVGSNVVLDNAYGVTTVVGDIIAARLDTGNGYSFNLNGNSNSTFVLTGSNNFFYTGTAGLVGTKGNIRGNLVLDYTTTDKAKLAGLTGGINWYAGSVTLIGGNTREEIGFMNYSGAGGVATLRVTRLSGGSSLVVNGFMANDGGNGIMVDINESGAMGTLLATERAGNNVNGIVAPWVTIGNNNGAGRDWAYVNTTDRLYYAYAGYDALGSANTVNALVNGDAAIAAPTTANTLKIDAATGGRLNLNGNTLTLTAGGLMYVGTGNYVIGGAGAVDGALAVTAPSLAIWQSGAGKLTINANFNTNADLRVTGGGALELNGVWTGNGFTMVDNKVVLTLGADQAIGRGFLSVQNGAVLELNGHSQKVSSILGGNVDVGVGTIRNSDPVNTATLTIGGGPAGPNLAGLNATDLVGNIRLLITGSHNSSHVSVSRKLNITGGIEFKDIILQAVRNGMDNSDSYWYMPAFDSTVITATTGELTFGGNGAMRFYNNRGYNVNNAINVTGTNNYLGIMYNHTFTGAITVGEGAEMTFGFDRRSSNTQTMTFSGPLSGVAGTMILSVQSDTAFNEFFALNAAASDLSNAAVVLAGGGAAAAPQIVTLQAAQTGSTYRLGSLSTMNNITGGVDLAAKGVAIVRNAAAGAVTFEIGGGNFAGHITNNGSYSGGALVDTGGQITNLTKVGTGTLNLTNLNTYSGQTTVSGGVLLISGTGSLSRSTSILADGGKFDYQSGAAMNAGAIVEARNGGNFAYNGGAPLAIVGLKIENGGILSGTGRINSPIMLNDGVLAPGNSIGIMDLVGDQGALWSDFTYDWEVDSLMVGTAGVNWDLVSIDGSLALGAANSYKLNILEYGGFAFTAGDAPQEYVILTTTGGITGFVAGNWDIEGNGVFELKLVGNTDLVLSYEAIPEPSTYALLLGGAALLALLRRRKK